MSQELYHEQQSSRRPADICIAFHPGVWGYDTWIPTIRAACLDMQLPFVITSYTEAEGEGDEEAIIESGLEGINSLCTRVITSTEC